MVEYRFAEDAHRAEIIDFINYVFSQAHRPHDFKTLIPKVYGDERGYADIHAIALESGKIRGVVGQLPFTVLYGGSPLNVGYIGSVSTHPYSRGEGHMIRLMDMQAERAKDFGIDIMMLGGQRQRYEYYGFSPVGLEYEYRIIPANVRHALRNVDAMGVNWKRFENASAEEIDAAYEIYQSQPITGARSREVFDLIMRSWYADPYVVRDGTRVVGLIDANDKDSFCELVLTDADYAPRLIKAWFAAYAPSHLSVCAPSVDPALNRALAAFAEGYSAHASEQVRIVNLVNVLKACMSLKKAVYGVSDGEVTFQMDDEKPVCVRVKDGDISVFETDGNADVTLSRLDMQQFLFSGNRFSAPSIALPVDWFPLPVFLYPADHF